MSESVSQQTTGCQINLDAGEANPSGKIVDDIRNACTILDVEFESAVRCAFTVTPDNYFRYKGIDWVPINHSEQMTQNGTYKYSIRAWPRYMFVRINSCSKDTRSFANSIGIQPTEVEFENIEIPCPLKNRFAAQLINEYRSQFFQEAYKKQDMSNSLILYMCGDMLLSLTFGKWKNNKALPLASMPLQASSSFFTNYDDQPFFEMIHYKGVAPWSADDYLERLFGKTFEINGTSAYPYLGRYTLSLNGSQEFDSDKTFMCVRTEEIIGSMSGFKTTFTEIKYAE